MAAVAVKKLLNTFSKTENEEEKYTSFEVPLDTTFDDAPDIDTDIVYNTNDGRRFTIDIAKKKFDLSAKTITHKVMNGRKADIMFETHGFQLIEQNTKLSNNDFYTNHDDIIQKVYYSEVESAVKQLTGAEEVIAVHHVIRNANGAPKSAKVKVEPPAHAAHCDYTGHSGFKSLGHGIAQLKMRKKYKDDVNYRQGRFAMINVWRNISDKYPIYNDHLAMCDGRSVIAPDDFLKYDYIANGYKSESYYLSTEHQQFHKWYYFPGMRKNELLVFMQYDSDFTAQSRYGFHTAIKDPNAKKGAPPRESIETRLVAYFPNHEPNTIPVMGEDDEKLDPKQVVKKAVKGLSDAINYPSYWPAEAKKELAEKLRKEELRDVVIWLVYGSRAGEFHGLKNASDDTCNKVVDEIMKKGDKFKKTALKKFPLE